HALDEGMRVVAQDIPVVTRAGLALVRIADEILLPGRARRHERQLETGREARAAAAAKPRRLDLLDDLRAVELAVQHALPGLVPADLVVVLERPRFPVELERREADEVLFPHDLLPASGKNRLTPANRGFHRA